MRRNGQAIGIGLALAFSAAAAVLCFGRDGGAEPLRYALWSGAALLSASVPLGWFLGFRYDRLKDWAEKDPLTGVCNRRFVQQGFPKLVAQADRRRKRFSVVLVDLNDFKAINDTLGHAKGDEVLRKFGRGLRDISRHGEIASRWGGDEFMLLCPYGDRASLDQLSRDIGELASRIALRGGENLGVSAGAAVYPDDGRVLEELMQAADRRMYAEKKHGKETPAQRLKA
ncbi:GGDEF domain-containing protein [Cohnella caldifontis]|uniref:GGDEF domain-containing protein n=1 Tax=Cohnella caldifontis TaxID=3027471 RepID=UPI0023ED7CAC|nr:GGDEF domain-containing protein [Cohnella sp. YIM B05605]